MKYLLAATLAATPLLVALAIYTAPVSAEPSCPTPAPGEPEIICDLFPTPTLPVPGLTPTPHVCDDNDVCGVSAYRNRVFLSVVWRNY